MSNIDKNNHIVYKFKKKVNGVYIFIIEGNVSVADETLSQRDGIGIWETDEISIVANKDSQALLIEVPIN